MTFYRWKKKLGLLEVKLAKRQKVLEAENRQLIKIVADQVLCVEVLQESLEKMLSPGHKR